MKVIAKYLLLIIVLLPASVQSKDINTYTFDLKDMDIISVSKKPEKIFEAAASVYVLTNEQIKRSGATSIPEALRLVPGLEVARIDANKWAISSRGFNRQFSNKLLVMIDGKTTYTPLTAGTFWDEIDENLDNIDRVEVIKGPGGTIWGANAVNGVINIITKNAKITQGTTITNTFGNFEKSTSEITHGGKAGDNLFYRASAKYQDTDSTTRLSGLGHNDNWHSGKGGLRIDFDKSVSETLMFKADIIKGRENQDYFLPNIAGPTYGDEKFSGASLVARYEQVLSENENIVLNSFIDYNQRESSLVGIERTTFEFDYQHNKAFNERNDLSWGLTYRYFLNDIDERLINGTLYLTYLPNKTNANLYSAFVQNKTALVPDKLYLTYGTKLEHNYYTGVEYEPSIRMTWLVNDNNVLWAAVSRAIRMPSIAERDINRIVTPALNNIGNPNYDSEEVSAYELGYRTILGDNLSLDNSIFYNVYYDLRSYRNPPNITLDNQGNAKIYGFESALEYTVNSKWNLAGSVSMISHNARLDAGVNDIGNLFYSDENTLPGYHLKLQSNYNISENIQFDNYLYYVDEIKVSTSNINPYLRFDSRIAWSPTKKVEISLVGQNLLDDKHQEFSEAIYTVPSEIGRSVYAKLAIKF